MDTLPWGFWRLGRASATEDAEHDSLWAPVPPLFVAQHKGPGLTGSPSYQGRKAASLQLLQLPAHSDIHRKLFKKQTAWLSG